MRQNYIEQIEILTKNLKEELQNFLFLKNLKNLINKLDDKQFGEEKKNPDHLLEALKVVSREYNRKNRKIYMTHFNEIKKRVSEKYGLKKKGDLFAIYFGTIFPISVAFGVVFKNIGLGASLGIVFASGIAHMKEKEAEKKGLIY